MALPDGSNLWTLAPRGESDLGQPLQTSGGRTAAVLEVLMLLGLSRRKSPRLDVPALGYGPRRAAAQRAYVPCVSLTDPLLLLRSSDVSLRPAASAATKYSWDAFTLARGADRAAAHLRA